jgi:uncharacterized membrane protein YfcA
VNIISDPIFYLAAIPAVIIFGLSKGGFGGSAAALSVPIMALTIDPLTAAAILLPVMLIMDCTALWKFRGKFNAHHLKILMPASVVGVVAAGLLMKSVSEDGMRLFLGTITTLFCLNYWLKPFGHHKPGKVEGYLWGAASGFTSTQIHAGGIPLGIYLYPQNLDKVILAGTSAIFLATVNIMKLIPYGLLGQFTTSNLSTSLVLIPLGPLGVLAGHWLLHRVDQKIIYRILYIFLFLAGIKLIYEALT